MTNSPGIPYKLDDIEEFNSDIQSDKRKCMGRW